jgi:hypothetical protein
MPTQPKQLKRLTQPFHAHNALYQRVLLQMQTLQTPANKKIAPLPGPLPAHPAAAGNPSIRCEAAGLSRSDLDSHNPVCTRPNGSDCVRMDNPHAKSHSAFAARMHAKALLEWAWLMRIAVILHEESN